VKRARYWSDSQIKEFVRLLRKRWGDDAWAVFVPAVRRALVAEAAFDIVAGQAADTVDVEALSELVQRMEERAGVS
jgi:hypothetical protein